MSRRLLRARRISTIAGCLGMLSILFPAGTAYSLAGLPSLSLTGFANTLLSGNALPRSLPSPEFGVGLPGVLSLNVHPKRNLASDSTHDFINFESGQVRPLAMSPDGSRLYAVNTPDNRLEIFAITDDGLEHLTSVPVGMEPVAVAVRANGEVWVVNHLSDSVSIVNATAAQPYVARTLLVGDEPRDIVFAGPNRSRVFITTAHRGQNSPYVNPDNPGVLETPGIGRADVWVFDVANLGSQPGGTPLTIVRLFTDTPRALAVTPDGSRVYAAGFKTGNQTTALSEETVCDGGQSAAPCRPDLFEQQAPGGLPAPNSNVEGTTQKEVGLIVKYNGEHWVDELGRSWDSMVRFRLPDLDVFAIDANASTPVQTQAYPHVGTVLFNMAVNPVNGKLYVSNTDANNAARFEGARPAGSTISTVQGKLALSRITVIDGSQVLPRYLNKHIDYSVYPAPAGVADRSLATPMGMAVSGDGSTLYLSAFGSGKIGVFSTSQLESDSFVPDAASHIVLSGGGPSGLVLDEPRHRLYALTRFNNSVAVVDTTQRQEIASVPMFDPEPAYVVNGRHFLYDARYTSGNGEASCASCHVFGDFDSLAWDLGNPLNKVATNDNPFRLGVVPVDTPTGLFTFHPMKGPMTTQSLRGLAGHGPMHWRGDRTGSDDAANIEPDQGGFDENAAFIEFNKAIIDLLGRASMLTDAEMQAFADFALRISYPPNPIRNLDNSLTPRQQKGHDFFFNNIADVTLNQCNGCHVVDPQRGLFGSDGRSTTEGETTEFKIPQLRNMYQKVGMFGRVQTSRDLSRVNNNQFMGDQIRGFGFRHDGSIDTLTNFLKGLVFIFPGGDAQRANAGQFVFAVDSNLAPIVGQQISVGPGVDATLAAGRLSLLQSRAQAGECELIAKGVHGGAPRGWWRDPADGLFVPDRASESALDINQLLASRQSGETLTFTCVPPGSGIRMGIDRNRNSVLDGDEGG